METIKIFDQSVSEYEKWYDQHESVFQSEVEAVRDLLPEGDTLSGIEIGLGTGRFSEALQIKEGIEPSVSMRKLAMKRGIETMDAVAEALPYGDLRFDFALMIFCISYFKNLHKPFKEALRVLKNDGSLIVGFIDKGSLIGKQYEAEKSSSTFYKNATFYSVDKVTEELALAGFKHFTYRQTLFGELDSIKAFQPSTEGYGQGSFVVVKAQKKHFK